VSGSRLLIEFQELCCILNLNPQVKKKKFLEKPKANGNLVILILSAKHNIYDFFV